FTGDGAGLKSQFYLIWRGAQMGAIMSPGAGSSVRVYVKLDNLWLHSGNGGPDVRWDDQDRSYVQVDEGRLYMLAHDTHRDRFHELSIFPGGPGAALYGFEFADQCEAALK
ncbi:MAG: hypothetical protein KGL53_05355, partial [Elusimicrobia bacterium]|nr:hypothetical protein [Elusimicrobiota bacterium]